MYVAVTRAKERLYLTRAKSRYLYGKRDDMTPSRFLKDANKIISPKKETESFYGGNRYANNDYGDDRYRDDRNSSGGGYSSGYAKSMLNKSTPTVKTNVNASDYKAGVKVKHAKFGIGTIIMTKNSGDNLIVSVAFNGLGIKELSAKYAPMEILK